MQRTYRWLDVITGAFVAVLLISNVASAKILRLGPFSFDGGTILPGDLDRLHQPGPNPEDRAGQPGGLLRR